MSLLILIIYVVALIVLVTILVVDDQRDKKKFENILNKSYKRNLDDEVYDDIEEVF